MIRSLPETGEALQKCRVLMVDSERIARDIVSRMLKKIGVAEVIEAPSAEQGWTHLSTAGAAGINVIITDLTLTGISGAAFIKRLRASTSSWARSVPIIVLTGDTSVELCATVRGVNISAYLIKPISAELLRETILRALAGGRTHFGGASQEIGGSDLRAAHGNNSYINQCISGEAAVRALSQLALFNPSMGTAAERRLARPRTVMA